MLDVFAMHSTLTESAYVNRTNIPAYEFVGDLSEATFSDANYVIMAEAADLAMYSVDSDEIITEAALANPAAVDVLVENVVDTVVAKAKKIWEKLISVVKGLIAKLKAFSLRIQGKTSKWASQMKSRIEAARNREGASDFKFTMHKWDLETLDTLKDMDSEIINKIGKYDEKINGLENESKVSANLHGGDDPQSEKVKSTIETYERLTETEKTEEAKNIEQLFNDFASKLGVSGHYTDASSLAGAVSKKISNGEKVEQAIYNQITNMFNFVESCADSINKVEDSYKKILETLSKQKDKLEKIEKDTASSENKTTFKDVPDNYFRAVRAYRTAVVHAVCQIYTTGHSILNSMKSVCTSNIKTIANEYMVALTKFSNIPDKKK